MKKYLSSYKLGDNPERLFQLFGESKKVAYIGNACDMFTNLIRKKEREDLDILDLERVGLRVEKVDLRDYFGKTKQLEYRLQDFGGVFVTGGNTFVLRQSYYISGLDEILKDYEKSKPDFVYAGYSAGVCILAPSLKGLDIVDEPDIYPYDEVQTTIWDSLGILDFSIAPHYKSDHPESKLVDGLIEYCTENKILFKALKDGEVIIYP